MCCWMCLQAQTANPRGWTVRTNLHMALHFFSSAQSGSEIIKLSAGYILPMTHLSDADVRTLSSMWGSSHSVSMQVNATVCRKMTRIHKLEATVATATCLDCSQIDFWFCSQSLYNQAVILSFNLSVTLKHKLLFKKVSKEKLDLIHQIRKIHIASRDKDWEENTVYTREITRQQEVWDVSKQKTVLIAMCVCIWMCLLQVNAHCRCIFLIGGIVFKHRKRMM